MSTAPRPGSAVRDARLRARGRGTLLRLVLHLAIVIGVGVLVFRALHEDRPPFRFVEGTVSVSTSGGEGLMGDRRELRQEPYDPDAGTDGPYLIALRGPGSTVLTYVELELDRDAPPMRIRQQGTRIDDHVEDVDERGRVQRKPLRLKWHGWVARQPRDYEDGPAVKPLPWRNAGGETGVLVEPGERVRLRTRYDVPASNARTCDTEVLGGGAEWEVERDGDDPGGDAGTSLSGDWKPLRARSKRRDDDHVLVRTGQPDRIGFRYGRAGCRDGGATGDIGPDFGW